MVVTAIYPGLILADGWCHHRFPSPAPLMGRARACARSCSPSPGAPTADVIPALLPPEPVRNSSLCLSTTSKWRRNKCHFFLC